MKSWFCSLLVLSGWFVMQSQIDSAQAQTKISSRLAKAAETEASLLVWITFKDKGDMASKYLDARRTVSTRALQRRAKMRPFDRLIEPKDYPLEAAYVRQVEGLGIKIRQPSRWFNAVSAWVSREQLSELEQLNCVANLDLVLRLKKDPHSLEFQSKDFIEDKAGRDSRRANVLTLDYGTSYTQVNQINVPAVHNLGIYGQGVMIGVFDAGFNNLGHEAFDSMVILATHDFVNGDSSVADDPGQMGEGSHGTNTLSVIGGFKNGQLIGPSFRSTFILAKTENTDSETPVEEDNWIAAMEWAEAYGVDVVSCSLGYIEFDGQSYYTWQWMNGDSCRITKAADMATWNGVVVVNSAGNENDNSSHNTLGAPADGDTVIAVGAVNSSGTRVSFSSVGPTVDGRIKPDVMAMGSGVKAAYGSPGATGYEYVDGTSFSCPLTAGVCGLILSTNPNLTPYQVREALRNTANNASSPNKYYGWGIVNALNAINYVHIQHTPVSDTENPAGPFPVEAVVTHAAAIDTVYLIYGLNGDFTNTLIMSSLGSSYTANIPSTGVPTRYNYYIKVKNKLGSLTYEPQGAPGLYHSFYAGADTVKPVITHTPLGNQALSAWPVPVSASVTDNIGVDSVIVEFAHNGMSQTPFRLARNGLTSEYGALFSNIPVAVGDYIDYRIIANDMATTSNTVIVPSSGYYRFYIVNLTVFSSDFNTTSGGLTGNNDWEWGVPSGSSPLPHSSPKLWATKLDTNYTDGPLLSTLTLPQLTAISGNASFTFWQAYEMENGYDGGNVKMAVNNGEYQIITPAGGYPVNALSTSWNNPIGGQPAFSGTALTWQQITFPLNGIVQSGDQVRIKFDFGADDSVVKIGWYIDDFSAVDLGTVVTDINSEEPATPDAFVLYPNYPNPFNPFTTIRYQLPAAGKVTLKIYNLLGQEVATLVNRSHAAGVYSAVWNGQNSTGHAVASGVYMYRLELISGEKRYASTKKLLLIK